MVLCMYEKTMLYRFTYLLNSVASTHRKEYKAAPDRYYMCREKRQQHVSIKCEEVYMMAQLAHMSSWSINISQLETQHICSTALYLYDCHGDDSKIYILQYNMALLAKKASEIYIVLRHHILYIARLLRAAPMIALAEARCRYILHWKWFYFNYWSYILTDDGSIYRLMPNIYS